MNGKTLLAVLAAVFTCLGTVIGLLIDEGPPPGKTKTATVYRDPEPTPAEKVLDKLPAKGEFDAPPPNDARPGVVTDRTAEPPAKVADQQEAAVDAQAYDTSRVLEGAAAKPADFICYTPMNGGPRALSDIGLMVAHVTVSLNVAGYADGEGLCGFFTRVQASATWIVDNEGNSWANVPLDRVPWTQAWFNRVSCSIEYVGSTGRPGEGPAQWTDVQLREGGRLFAKCAKAANIPVRSGAVNTSTGTIIRTGLITHQELGAKGGGHSDPGPEWDRERQLLWIRHYLHPCERACQLRAKHQRTHERYRKNDCKARFEAHPNLKGYCLTLRHRNKAIHLADRREHIGLAGTYR